MCQRVLRLNDERGSLHRLRPWMRHVRRRRGVCYLHVCIDGIQRDLYIWLLARALQRDLRCCVPEELLQPRQRMHPVRFFMCHLQRPHCR